MAPENSLEKRAPRKLTKRRQPVRASSVQYPERLKVGEDAQEDVTAAKGKSAQYMNQSVFSMIAAAGSKTDFHARFEGEDSDSEDDQNGPDLMLTPEEQATELSVDGGATKEHEGVLLGEKSRRPNRKKNDDKGLHALPKLKLKTARERNYMSQSVLLPPKESQTSHKSPKGVTPRDAPVMSKMLEAQAQLDPIPDVPQRQTDISEDTGKLENTGSHVSLATRLMEIFGFESPEEVISGTNEQV